MAKFIKTGYWSEKKTGYEGELNLTKEILETALPQQIDINSKLQTVNSISALQLFTDASIAYFDGSTWERKSGNVSSNGGSYAGTLIRVSSLVYWERKFNNQVNARWFGLIGDGTIETQKLQLAVSNSIGYELFIESGTYITNNITVYSNTTIIGKNAILKMVGNSPLDNSVLSIINATNVKVEGLEIDLSLVVLGDIYAGTSAIEIRYSNNITIKDCFIHDSKYVAIRFTVSNNNCTVTECQITNTDTGIISTGGIVGLIATNNRINGGTSEGITIYGLTSNTPAEHFLIQGNIISDKEAYGISIPYGKNGIISNNNIYNCLGGVTLNDTNLPLITSDILIDSNHIEGTSFGIRSTALRITVTNNFLKNFINDAINVEGYIGNDSILIADTTNISNNHIISPAQVGGNRAGIHIKDVVNCYITNNKILTKKISGGSAIYFQGIMNNVYIENNISIDGSIVTPKTIFDENIFIMNNKFSFFYINVVQPINYIIKLIVADNIFTNSSQLNKLISSASGIAISETISPQIVARNNNDVLIGINYKPTFLEQGFTGISKFPVMFRGAEGDNNSYPITVKGDGLSTINKYTGIKLMNGNSNEYSKWVGMIAVAESAAANQNGFSIVTNDTQRLRVFHDGQVCIQSGGTFTNSGELLQVNGTGRFTGNILAPQHNIPALNTPPASATATGTTGEIRWANGFVYLCVATNTWQRSALTTW
jgi:hypothetical protein